LIGISLFTFGMYKYILKRLLVITIPFDLKICRYKSECTRIDSGSHEYQVSHYCTHAFSVHFAMIMKILVASSDLLEPGCYATELVDLNSGSTRNALDEFESDHTL